MLKYTKQFTWSPSKRSLSRSFRQKNSEKFPNWKNALSMKSTFCRPCKAVPTLSSTSTCSKPPTTSTSFTSSATEVPSTNSSKKKAHCLKESVSFTFARSLKHSKSYPGTILCIAISNRITFSCTMATSKLLILDFANLCKIPTN